MASHNAFNPAFYHGADVVLGSKLRRPGSLSDTSVDAIDALYKEHLQ